MGKDKRDDAPLDTLDKNLYNERNKYIIAKRYKRHMSIIGAIISGIATARSSSKSRVAITGLIISLMVFITALIRLSIGGGIL